MFFRIFGILAVLAVGGIFSAGCGKQPGAASAPSTKPALPTAETVARLHWVGKKQMGADTNAAYILDICNLPQTRELELQVLDKLSLAPWKMRSIQGAQSNPTEASLLRPLLDDVLSAEWNLEVRSVTNLPGEVVFAIRLEEERAALWQTNLAAVVESLSGARREAAANAGWTIRMPGAFAVLELVRVGNWTLVGAAPATNASLRGTAARVQSSGVPYAATQSNVWFEVDVDPNRVSTALSLGWNLPGRTPRVSFQTVGVAEGVQTRGELRFDSALPIRIDAWNVPTNLVHEPLVAFTALNGVRPLLESFLSGVGFGPGGFPNQAFVWAQDGVPFFTHFAFPSSDPSNVVAHLSERWLTNANAWIATNAMGRIDPKPGETALSWMGLPIIIPYLRPAGLPENGFVYGGLVASAVTNKPMPVELLTQITQRTNAVCYDWELTGPHMQELLYCGQLARIIFRKGQLEPDSLGIKWLQALPDRMGNCVTLVSIADPGRLAFVRRSSLGLTARELHLLVDWVESPHFPSGFHSTLVSDLTAHTVVTRTNAPGQTPKTSSQ